MKGISPASINGKANTEAIAGREEQFVLTPTAGEHCNSDCMGLGNVSIRYFEEDTDETKAPGQEDNDHSTANHIAKVIAEKCVNEDEDVHCMRSLLFRLLVLASSDINDVWLFSTVSTLASGISCFSESPVPF